MSLVHIIKQINVPKVIPRYIIMNFLDMASIKNLILHVREMNVLNRHNKKFLEKANKGFGWNCENGYIDVAQWLLSLNRIDIHANNEHAFRWACRNGWLDVVQWLHSLGRSDANATGQPAACGQGYFGEDPQNKLVREMRTHFPQQGGIDIHASNECAFKWSCENGRLDVAQWLREIGSINIHVDDECAFRLACNNNHLNVAQWLHSLGGIDFCIFDHETFRSSKNEIKEWLQTIE